MVKLRGILYEKLQERKAQKKKEKDLELMAFKQEKERLAAQRGKSKAVMATQKGIQRAREGGLARRTLRKRKGGEVI